MSLLDWYYRLPVALQDTATTIYGAKLMWMRSGAERRRTLAELRSTQRRSPAEGEKAQLAAFNRLIMHAVATVPFYQARRSVYPLIRHLTDATSLPILDKEGIRQAGPAMVSTDAPSRTYTIHTGGTTGTPLSIYCDGTALQRNYAFFDRLREWAGIGKRGRVATFAGRPIAPPAASAPPYWRRNRLNRAVLFSSYHISLATIPDYLQGLSRFNPDLIDSYPSSLAPIARYMLAHDHPAVRPRAIITSSETLSPEDRDAIESAFQCQVFDQYGAAEMVAFVAQCEHRRYHVNTEYGLLEVLVNGRPAEPGESGDLVATGFGNPVMPLIRYATGDRAVRGTGPCPCGRTLPTLERIEGRRDDVIRTPDGRLIGRLDPIFKAVSSLFETQIIQDRPDHVRVEIVATPQFGEAEAASLLRELSLRLGPSMKISLTKVPQIDRTRSGKLRSVINLVS